MASPTLAALNDGASPLLNNKTVLPDAGSSEAFYENAKKLGIKPENADICVLSHDHYDHSGGFAAVPERNNSLKIYANKNAFGNFLSGNGGLHFIGIPDNVKKYTDSFILTNGVAKLDEAIYLVPRSANVSTGIGREICTMPQNCLDKLCQFINDENITHIYTGHFTGAAGLDELKKRLDNVHALTSGLCFEL